MHKFETLEYNVDSMTDAELSVMADTATAAQAVVDASTQDIGISYKTIQKVLNDYSEEQLKRIADRVLGVLEYTTLEKIAEEKSKTYVCLDMIKAVLAFVMIHFYACEKLYKKEVFYETRLIL